jgi:RNA polymerase sigma-70 factor (ECF subfamily)
MVVPPFGGNAAMVAALEDRRVPAQRQLDEAFLDVHYRDVYRFFLWLSNDPDLAADLTQESFAAYWESRRRAQLPGEADRRAWLYAVARNRWRKRCRDLHPTSGVDEALECPDASPGPPELLEQSWNVSRIARAVAGLPFDFREALVLRVFEELSYGEISEVLGIGEGLARWRVHRARILLAAEIAREDEE